MGDRNWFKGKDSSRWTGVRLRLEGFEERWTPAVITWDGEAAATGDPSWKNALNWAGNIAPIAGDDLVFPIIYDTGGKGIEQTGQILQTRNDFPAGTAFNSLTVNAAGYVLGGSNLVRVTSGSFTTDLSNVTKIGGVVDVQLPLEFPSGTGTVTYTGSNAAANNRGLVFTAPGLQPSLQFSKSLTFVVSSGANDLNPSVTISGQIVDDGSKTGVVTVTGTKNSTIAFASQTASSYGETQVRGATLRLGGPIDQGIPGNLVVDGANARVELLNPGSQIEQIPNTATVILNNSGVMDLGGSSEQFTTLSLRAGGQLLGAGGLLTLSGTPGLDLLQSSGNVVLGPRLNVTNNLVTDGTFTIQQSGDGRDGTNSLTIGGIQNTDKVRIRFQGGRVILNAPAATGASYTTEVKGGTLLVNMPAGQGEPAIPGDLYLTYDGVRKASGYVQLLSGNGVADSGVVYFQRGAQLEISNTVANVFLAPYDPTYVERFAALASIDDPANPVPDSVGREVLNFTDSLSAFYDNLLTITPTSYYTFNGDIIGSGRLTVELPPGVGRPEAMQVFTGSIQNLRSDSTTFANFFSRYRFPIQPITVQGRAAFLDDAVGVEGLIDYNVLNSKNSSAVNKSETGTVYGSFADGEAGFGTLRISAGTVSNLIPGRPVFDPTTGELTVEPGTLSTQNLSFDSSRLTIHINSETEYGKVVVSNDLYPVVTVNPFTIPRPNGVFNGILDVQLAADYLAQVDPGSAFTIVDFLKPTIRLSSIPGAALTSETLAAYGEFALISVPTASGETVPFYITYQAGEGANDIALYDGRPQPVTVGRFVDNTNPANSQPAVTTANEVRFEAVFEGVVQTLNDQQIRVATTNSLTYGSVRWEKVAGTKNRFTIIVSGLAGSGNISVSLLEGATFSQARVPSLPSESLSTNVVTVNVVPQPPLPPPVIPTEPIIAARMLVGAGPGGGGQVHVYQGTLSPTAQIVQPSPQFAGGVRVASGDFNRDGIRDYVFATGPGYPSFVQVVDGKTGVELFRVEPFEPTFYGGVNVTAGDVTGDGIPDLVVSPDEGGGPRVIVYNTGNQFEKLADFFGIDDPNFRGGARPAVGDVNGDGVGDLIVAAGYGGGPRVAIYDGTSLSGRPVKLTADFFAFEPGLRNGVYIAGLDINGDGYAEVVAGGGPGGGPRIVAYSGKSLLTGQLVPIVNFFAGNPEGRAGIRIAAADFDGDDRLELVTGSGQADGSKVQVFRPANLRLLNPVPDAAFDAFPGFDGGVYVG